jgi:hypothetical protein
MISFGDMIIGSLVARTLLSTHQELIIVLETKVRQGSGKERHREGEKKEKGMDDLESESISWIDLTCAILNSF